MLSIIATPPTRSVLGPTWDEPYANRTEMLEREEAIRSESPTTVRQDCGYARKRRKGSKWSLPPYPTGMGARRWPITNATGLRGFGTFSMAPSCSTPTAVPWKSRLE